MTDKLFLFDYKTQTSKGYNQLVIDINTIECLPGICYTQDTYKTFLTIIASILYGNDLVLLDADFSEQELVNLGIASTDITKTKPVTTLSIKSIDDIVNRVKESSDWELTLYTSGTTGIPKKVTHKLSSLTRAVRISPKHKDDVWGFAYNPTHIAGLQVFFQAFLNKNSIINIFDSDRDVIKQLIVQHSITNISATPTFFRMLMPLNDTFPTIKKLTSGGEKFDAKLAELLTKAFPYAKLRNVYASTEAGTILESRNDAFSIVDNNLCQIRDGELYIHKSLLGDGIEGCLDENQWYATGDLVEIITENPLSFRFLQRKNEMINVGGYKVNPHEVEQVLEHHPAIKQAYVYGKPNPVLGNVLMADVIAMQPIKEKELREYLTPQLQPFKIPRIINFVDAISLTRTGKLKRT